MNPWSGLRRLPREVWVLSAATLVNRAGTMVLPFLTLYVTGALGQSAARAGLVMALYGATALAVAPAAGRLCDRFGSLRLMKLSLAATGLLMLAFPLARSWPMLLVATVALGLASESFRPAMMATVSHLVGGELMRPAFALVRLAVNLGMSIGPAVGGFLAEASFRWIFWLDGATSLAAWAVLGLALSGSERREAGEPGSASAPAARATSAAHRDPRMILFLAALVPVGVVFFQHVSAMPLYLVRDLGLSPSTYGLLFTINTAMIVVLEVPFTGTTAAWPHQRLMGLGCVLFGTGFGALALARGAWTVAATVVVWTFGEMLLFPAMNAYVSDIAPAERRGEYMGLFMMAFGASFMLGPWAGTLVMDRLGPKVLWAGTLALGLVSGAMMWALPGRPPGIEPRRHALD